MHYGKDRDRGTAKAKVNVEKMLAIMDNNNNKKRIMTRKDMTVNIVHKLVCFLFRWFTTKQKI